MQVMLLVLDVGNTKTAVGVHHDGEWIADWRVTTHLNHLADEYYVLLKALLERQGPVSGTALLEKARSAASEPAQVVDCFASGLIERWCSDDARRFRGLYDRLPADLKRQVSYLEAIEKLLDALTALFRGWARDGRMRDDVPPRLLAWEFGAPIGNLRTSYWAWGQPPAVVRRGRRLAKAHVRYFISCALEARPRSRSCGRGGPR